MKKLPSKRPLKDKQKNPVVVFHDSQTRVEMAGKDEIRAIQAAYYVTLSPHEWVWTTQQSCDMAQYCLWAHQRLSAIEQLVTRK